jgi:hypothetical protein
LTLGKLAAQIFVHVIRRMGLRHQCDCSGRWHQQAAQCRASVLVGKCLQIGRIGAGPAEDFAKQHGHNHRAHERKGVEARIAGGHLTARLDAGDS